LKEENHKARQVRQKHSNQLIRADFNDPLGVLGILAV
jgi:hypothetical protein